ncbi:ankyrin repeat domain-containing protein [Portibacter marinus]|uniref:ankyrin repeat domain-containing protein n=1 Tax=Portibacter marinus TaxID=2898660 RepID=UPI001F178F19|nr:ankyrin repeat domain-containing protein [Portibacter marinus]
MDDIVRKISQGRTDLIFDLMAKKGWKERLFQDRIKILQWLVYYDDLTAIKAVIHNGGTLESININDELGNAAFFGHWKICEFLIRKGADVNYHVDKTEETPLHNALCKAGRPYYLYTLKVLIENGANVNARTKPGIETGGFMRDVRTRGETPLHRAAAYADEIMIRYLLEKGADVTAKDAFGDSPLTWASRHLRPGNILALLTFGEHRIGENHQARNTSDHGAGWGNGMDWNLYGEYVK